ncbi:MAG: MBL fold metallo-hydrolase [Alphaproteobacteria bacterium]|nr:MBL fold metallo-hydrolase [Alphaproteobacteria bacterium]
MSFKVKFWGVRGSVPCPGPDHLTYGGNTSCIEVAMGGERVILDAGTGIRNLGKWLMRKHVTSATILLSHTHWDHICGLPFFRPAFLPGYSFKIMAGHLQNGKAARGIADVIAGQMSDPFFPVPIEAMKASLSFVDFRAGESFDLSPRVHVRTTPLNHPDGSTGYRLSHAGKSLCYVTDTEHVPGHADEKVLSLIEGADLVIYDATYTDKEFPAKAGWGHSTWEEGIRLCRAADVKRLAIFHHDPDHEDRVMEAIEANAMAVWGGAFVARDNMRVNLD